MKSLLLKEQTWGRSTQCTAINIFFNWRKLLPWTSANFAYVHRAFNWPKSACI